MSQIFIPSCRGVCALDRVLYIYNYIFNLTVEINIEDETDNDLFIKCDQLLELRIIQWIHYRILMVYFNIFLNLL